MSKFTKKLLTVFILSLLTSCIAIPTHALSVYERKMYGQNNIIFYKPCGTQETVGAAQAAASNQVTAYGDKVNDKFYYALKSITTDTEKFQKYYAYYLYISRFDTTKRISIWVTTFDINANPSGSDFKNFLNHAIYSDESTLSNVGDETMNEIIAYLVYSAKSDLESMTFPVGDSSYDDLLEEAKSYVPKPGNTGNSKSWPTTATAGETGSESGTETECVNNLLDLGSGSPSGGGTTTTGGGTASYSDFTVVSTPIPLQTYVSGLRSRGIYQGARDWKHSEERNGKYGWNDQCLQLANAQSNGLLKGTYPSTDVTHNPDQGSGWTQKDNATLSEFLSIIYEQINRGHPVVIKVGLHRNKDLEKYYPSTSTKDTRHFVSVVGYKKSVTSASQLTLNDLYILDSWDAKLINSDSSSSRVIRPNDQISGQSGNGYTIRYQN